MGKPKSSSGILISWHVYWIIFSRPSAALIADKELFGGKLLGECKIGDRTGNQLLNRHASDIQNTA